MTRPKKISIALVAVVFVAIAWFSGYLPFALVGLVQSVSEPVPPNRPDGVPPEAVWSGGWDGGVFIDCAEVAGSDSSFDCVVYFDHGGDIWIRDTFCLNTGTTTLDSLKNLYGSYNGRGISLMDGRHLLPIVDREAYGGQQYKMWYDSQVSAGWHMETFRSGRH